MHHDSGAAWRADNVELVRIGSETANREGLHARYTTDMEAAWPDLSAVINWGNRVQVEPRGTWLLMRGPKGPVPKELWKVLG